MQTFLQHDQELFMNISSLDFLNFQFKTLSYKAQLAECQVKTKQLCAARAFRRTLNGQPVIYYQVNFSFMGGSFGCAEGEKLQRAAQLAYEENIPLIIDAASGGVRM